MERKRVKPAVTQDDEVMVVTSSIGSKKNPKQSSSERKVLSVKKFLSEPAYVRVSAGQTINLGDYESQRVDVSITMPCYPEEVDEVLPFVADKVGVFLEEEVERWGGGKNGTVSRS